MDNKTFFSFLKTTSVRYMLCDLHVHSIASADILDENRYSQLGSKEKELIESQGLKLDMNGKWAQYDDLVASRIKPEDYLQIILERRNQIASSYDLSEGKDWAIIAITDHNTCKFSCKLSKQAWDNRKQHRLIIFPGMELEVHFKVQEQNIKVHICIIFAPCVEEAQIHGAINTAYRKANRTEESNWNYGSTIQLANIEEFIRALRSNPLFPALCLAAHVSTSKGIQHETSEALEQLEDFTAEQAEYARLTAELEEIKSLANSYAYKQIKMKIIELEQKINKNNIEALKIIGRCGFDALQVKQKHDDRYYRCLHRFKEEYGRAVTVLSSDAHRVQDIFNCGDKFISYIKFGSQKLTSQEDFFDALRNVSIRFGETRFTCIPENKVNCYIKGVEITALPDSKEFWPFKDKQFVLPFSPNLNCLIGGRGSGKSAMIEALAFAVNNDVLDTKVKNQDWYKRARNTLAGCSIRVCWAASKSSFKDLDKKSLFSRRYFDLDENYDPPEYRDIAGNELTDGSLKAECKVQVFRMGDLEKQATDHSLMRKLFDDICGGSINVLEQQITNVLAQLKEGRQDIKKVLVELAKLTKEDAPLRKYIIRKVQYDNVNTPENKAKYEKLDSVVAAKTAINQAKRSWDIISAKTIIEKFKKDISGYLDDIERKTKDQTIKSIHSISALRISLFEITESKQPLKKEMLDRLDKLLETIDEIARQIVSTQSLLETGTTVERNNLEKEGLPTDGAKREAKKNLFEESKQALADYDSYTTKLDALYKERVAHFKELTRLAQNRTTLREDTATKISEKLRQNLDPAVLVIEANAHPVAEKTQLAKWLDLNMFPSRSFAKLQKIQALLDSQIMPEQIRDLLFAEGDQGILLVNEHLKPSEGRIDEDIASHMVQHARICYKFSFEDEIKQHQLEKGGLPISIQDGIKIYEEDENKIDAVIQLDEILFDDIPEIRLKDRPAEMPEARPITELSAGQRCSAILPIILLNGDCPLIIDQPEDNLDNRLVREVVVNILAAMKLRRQIIMATHNPNLPVLGDVEQTIILKAVEQDKCELQASGDIDKPIVVRTITEIMEGGREAFQYRQSIYQPHWNNPIEEPLHGTELE